jgi:ribonuclease III
VAHKLDVPERLRATAPHGVGKNSETLIESDRILASITEAVIGAAYTTWGFERVAPAIVDAFADQIEDSLENPVDFKSLLQERLAQRAEVVSYRIEEEQGPPHDRSFVAIAEVDGEEIGRGQGRTKKAAEQDAASQALEHSGEAR